jgi:hypothetical protein
MKSRNLIVFALCLSTGQAVNAGQVTGLTQFQPNTPAKASEVNGNFAAVQSAVNDNDTRLSNVEVSVAGGNVKGALLAMFGGGLIFKNNPSIDNSGYNGYYPLAPQGPGSNPDPDVGFTLQPYTLPAGVVSANAYVQTTCTFDGDGTSGQALQTQAVIRSPASSTANGSTTGMIEGSINSFSNFVMQTGVPAPSTMVQNTSFDYFTLTAPNTYDFGVWFSKETPHGTNDSGYCSIIVMIYRR